MSGLVSGYSGIIAPPNLATNGGFHINQRGEFRRDQGSLAAKSGDYVADCWYVDQSSDVDYLEVQGAHDGGNNNSQDLNLKGYGKKGQKVLIVNRDTELWAQNFGTDSMYTASVSCKLVSGSVPVSVSTVPRKRGGLLVDLYNSIAYLDKPETTAKHAVRIIKAGQDWDVSRSYITVTLEEDGEFHVSLEDFRLFAGAFKNPPKYAPVPYADDLARCQRYYQTGISNIESRAVKYNTQDARLGECIDLKTVMTSIPTVNVSLNTLYIRDGVGASNNRASTTNVNIQPEKDSFTYFLQNTESTFAAQMYNNGFTCKATWTAEVV